MEMALWDTDTRHRSAGSLTQRSAAFQRFSATWPIHRGASSIVEHHHRQQTPTLSAERFCPSVRPSRHTDRGASSTHVISTLLVPYHYLSVEQAINLHHYFPQSGTSALRPSPPVGYIPDERLCEGPVNNTSTTRCQRSVRPARQLGPGSPRVQQITWHICAYNALVRSTDTRMS